MDPRAPRVFVVFGSGLKRGWGFWSIAPQHILKKEITKRGCVR
jgi:hypothetical protein